MASLGERIHRAGGTGGDTAMTRPVTTDDTVDGGDRVGDGVLMGCWGAQQPGEFIHLVFFLSTSKYPGIIAQQPLLFVFSQ